MKMKLSKVTGEIAREIIVCFALILILPLASLTADYLFTHSENSKYQECIQIAKAIIAEEIKCPLDEHLRIEDEGNRGFYYYLTEEYSTSNSGVFEFKDKRVFLEQATAMRIERVNNREALRVLTRAREHSDYVAYVRRAILAMNIGTAVFVLYLSLLLESNKAKDTSS